MNCNPVVIGLTLLLPVEKKKKLGGNEKQACIPTHTDPLGRCVSAYARLFLLAVMAEGRFIFTHSSF